MHANTGPVEIVEHAVVCVCMVRSEGAACGCHLPQVDMLDLPEQLWLCMHKAVLVTGTEQVKLLHLLYISWNVTLFYHSNICILIDEG